MCDRMQPGNSWHFQGAALVGFVVRHAFPRAASGATGFASLPFANAIRTRRVTMYVRQSSQAVD